MSTSNKKAKLSVVALALVACLMIVGISAYLTATDSAQNTFTVGEVKLDLIEPEYPGNDDPEVKDITPNQEIAKDPQINNNGTNDEFVFLTVEVPVAEVVTAAADGSLLNNGEAARTQLFTLNGLSDKWALVEQDLTGETSNKYVYAYVGDDAAELDALAKGETTPALFTSVTLVNVIEGEVEAGVAQHININAYGIQTENINGDQTAPAAVWEVICNQKGI